MVNVNNGLNIVFAIRHFKFKNTKPLRIVQIYHAEMDSKERETIADDFAGEDTNIHVLIDIVQWPLVWELTFQI